MKHYPWSANTTMLVCCCLDGSHSLKHQHLSAVLEIHLEMFPAAIGQYVLPLCACLGFAYLTAPPLSTFSVQFDFRQYHCPTLSAAVPRYVVALKMMGVSLALLCFEHGGKPLAAFFGPLQSLSNIHPSQCRSGSYTPSPSPISTMLPSNSLTIAPMGGSGWASQMVTDSKPFTSSGHR